MGTFLLVAIGLSFLIFWVLTFVNLMTTPDDDFRGRYDKILWCAAFIFAFIPAPIAYLAYRFGVR